MTESMASEPAEPTTRPRDELIEKLLAAVVAADTAEYQPEGEDSDENWWRYIITKAVMPTLEAGLLADPAQTTELPRLARDELINQTAQCIIDTYAQYAPVPGVLHSEAGNIARALADASLLADPQGQRPAALLPRLAELAEASGKLRTAEWLRTCASLPVEEWPAAPAYKGPMVPAAERDERQARIDAALALHTEFKIYDECEHDSHEGIGGDVYIHEIGETCEDAYLYSICGSCCTDGDYQDPQCVDDHERPCWPCPTRAALVGDQPKAEEPRRAPCPEGYHFVGQPLTHCSECGLPPWYHAGMSTLEDNSDPFGSGGFKLRPWTPGEREALRAKWEPVLSGVALRDVEEADDAAGDLP